MKRSLPFIGLKNVRPLPLVMAGLCLITQVVFAHRAEAAFWEDRRRALRSASSEKMTLASLPLGNVLSLPSVSDSVGPVSFFSTLPKRVAQPIRNTALQNLIQAWPGEAALVRGLSDPTSSPQAPVVLHLQDVHSNDEAQKNISDTVRSLIDTHQIDLVAVEGSEGFINVDLFRRPPQRAALAPAADFLLEEKDLPGVLHGALLSRALLPPVIGVDSQKLYRANVQAYRSAVERAPAYEQQLERVRGDLQRKKTTQFNAALKAFDDGIEKHHQNTLSLGDYAELLSKGPGPRGRFLDRFLEAARLEKNLDFKAVEAERARVVEQLAQRLHRDEWNRLLQLAMGHRLGQVTHGQFYGTLTGLLQRHGVPLPATLDAYVHYVLLSEGIDAAALHREMSLREKALYQHLASTPMERALVQQSRAVYLTGRLLDFGLTTEEWREYKTAGPRDPLGSTFRLAPFEAFYRLAEGRDAAMADHLLNAMARHGARRVLLVSGGFHNSGLVEHMDRAGAVTVTLVPRLTRVNAEEGSAYLTVFSQTKTSLDQLFQGEKLFLTPNPWTNSLRVKLAVVLLALGTPRELFRSLLPRLPKAVDVEISQTKSETIITFFHRVKKTWVSLGVSLQNGRLGWMPSSNQRGVAAAAGSALRQVKRMGIGVILAVSLIFGSSSGQTHSETPQRIQTAYSWQAVVPEIEKVLRENKLYPSHAKEDEEQSKALRNLRNEFHAIQGPSTWATYKAVSAIEKFNRAFIDSKKVVLLYRMTDQGNFQVFPFQVVEKIQGFDNAYVIEGLSGSDSGSFAAEAVHGRILINKSEIEKNLGPIREILKSRDFESDPHLKLYGKQWPLEGAPYENERILQEMVGAALVHEWEHLSQEGKERDAFLAELIWGPTPYYSFAKIFAGAKKSDVPPHYRAAFVWIVRELMLATGVLKEGDSSVPPNVQEKFFEEVVKLDETSFRLLALKIYRAGAGRRFFENRSFPINPFISKEALEALQKEDKEDLPSRSVEQRKKGEAEFFSVVQSFSTVVAHGPGFIRFLLSGVLTDLENNSPLNEPEMRAFRRGMMTSHAEFSVLYTQFVILLEHVTKVMTENGSSPLGREFNDLQGFLDHVRNYHNRVFNNSQLPLNWVAQLSLALGLMVPTVFGFWPSDILFALGPWMVYHLGLAFSSLWGAFRTPSGVALDQVDLKAVLKNRLMAQLPPEDRSRVDVVFADPAEITRTAVEEAKGLGQLWATFHTAYTTVQFAPDGSPRVRVMLNTAYLGTGTWTDVFLKPFQALVLHHEARRARALLRNPHTRWMPLLPFTEPLSFLWDLLLGAQGRARLFAAALMVGGALFPTVAHNATAKPTPALPSTEISTDQRPVAAQANNFFKVIRRNLHKMPETWGYTRVVLSGTLDDINNTRPLSEAEMLDLRRRLISESEHQKLKSHLVLLNNHLQKIISSFDEKSRPLRNIQKGLTLIAEQTDQKGIPITPEILDRLARAHAEVSYLVDVFGQKSIRAQSSPSVSSHDNINQLMKIFGPTAEGRAMRVDTALQQLMRGEEEILNAYKEQIHWASSQTFFTEYFEWLMATMSKEIVPPEETPLAKNFFQGLQDNGIELEEKHRHALTHLLAQLTDPLASQTDWEVAMDRFNRTVVDDKNILALLSTESGKKEIVLYRIQKRLPDAPEVYVVTPLFGKHRKDFGGAVFMGKMVLNEPILIDTAKHIENELPKKIGHEVFRLYHKQWPQSEIPSTDELLRQVTLSIAIHEWEHLDRQGTERDAYLTSLIVGPIPYYEFATILSNLPFYRERSRGALPAGHRKTFVWIAHKFLQATGLIDAKTKRLTPDMVKPLIEKIIQMDEVEFRSMALRIYREGRDAPFFPSGSPFEGSVLSGNDLKTLQSIDREPLRHQGTFKNRAKNTFHQYVINSLGSAPSVAYGFIRYLLTNEPNSVNKTAPLTKEESGDFWDALRLNSPKGVAVLAHIQELERLLNEQSHLEDERGLTQNSGFPVPSAELWRTYNQLEDLMDHARKSIMAYEEEPHLPLNLILQSAVAFVPWVSLLWGGLPMEWFWVLLPWAVYHTALFVTAVVGFRSRGTGEGNQFEIQEAVDREQRLSRLPSGSRGQVDVVFLSQQELAREVKDTSGGWRKYFAPFTVASTSVVRANGPPRVRVLLSRGFLGTGTWTDVFLKPFQALVLHHEAQRARALLRNPSLKAMWGLPFYEPITFAADFLSQWVQSLPRASLKRTILKTFFFLSALWPLSVPGAEPSIAPQSQPTFLQPASVSAEGRSIVDVLNRESISLNPKQKEALQGVLTVLDKWVAGHSAVVRPTGVPLGLRFAAQRFNREVFRDQKLHIDFDVVEGVVNVQLLQGRRAVSPFVDVWVAKRLLGSEIRGVKTDNGHVFLLEDDLRSTAEKIFKILGQRAALPEEMRALYHKQWPENVPVSYDEVLRKVTTSLALYGKGLKDKEGKVRDALLTQLILGPVPYLELLEIVSNQRRDASSNWVVRRLMKKTGTEEPGDFFKKLEALTELELRTMALGIYHEGRDATFFDPDTLALGAKLLPKGMLNTLKEIEAVPGIPLGQKRLLAEIDFDQEVYDLFKGDPDMMAMLRSVLTRDPAALQNGRRLTPEELRNLKAALSQQGSQIDLFAYMGTLGEVLKSDIDKLVQQVEGPLEQVNRGLEEIQAILEATGRPLSYPLLREIAGKRADVGFMVHVFAQGTFFPKVPSGEIPEASLRTFLELWGAESDRLERLRNIFEPLFERESTALFSSSMVPRLLDKQLVFFHGVIELSRRVIEEQEKPELPLDVFRSALLAIASSLTLFFTMGIIPVEYFLLLSGWVIYHVGLSLTAVFGIVAMKDTNPQADLERAFREKLLVQIPEKSRSLIDVVFVDPSERKANPLYAATAKAISTNGAQRIQVLVSRSFVRDSAWFKPFQSLVIHHEVRRIKALLRNPHTKSMPGLFVTEPVTYTGHLVARTAARLNRTVRLGVFFSPLKKFDWGMGPLRVIVVLSGLVVLGSMMVLKMGKVLWPVRTEKKQSVLVKSFLRGVFSTGAGNSPEELKSLLKGIPLNLGVRYQTVPEVQQELIERAYDERTNPLFWNQLEKNLPLDRAWTFDTARETLIVKSGWAKSPPASFPNERPLTILIDPIEGLVQKALKNFREGELIYVVERPDAQRTWDARVKVLKIPEAFSGETLSLAAVEQAIVGDPEFQSARPLLAHPNIYISKAAHLSLQEEAFATTLFRQSVVLLVDALLRVQSLNVEDLQWIDKVARAIATAA